MNDKEGFIDYEEYKMFMEFYRQKEIEFYKYLNEQHKLKTENINHGE